MQIGGADAIISLARGNYEDVALSAMSMVPVVGDAIGKGGKVLKFAAKHGDEVADVGKVISRLDDVSDASKPLIKGLKKPHVKGRTK